MRTTPRPRLNLLDPSGAFTDAEILSFNRRHDEYYGWHLALPGIYTNANRLPETFRGSIQDYWRMRHAQSQETN